MDLNTLRETVTVLAFVIFIAIWAWAWARPNKARFDQAAQLPFESD